MELYITLAVLAFMIINFLWQKFPMGLTTMACCTLLAIFKVLTPSEAFQGFTNNSIILVAPMMALSVAITKTSIVPRIRAMVDDLGSKTGMALVFFFFLVTIAFVQFIPATATFSILVVFLTTLSNSGEVTASRLLMPMLGISCAWKGYIPIGMGATSFATINARYETIINNPDYLLKMMDKFKVAAIPVIALTLWCLFAWRLLPKEGNVSAKGMKEVKETKVLPPAQEKLVFVVFAAVMAVLVLNKWTGSLMYIAPAAGIIILIYGGALTIPEVTKALTADMIFLMAGVLGVAAAMSKSGAGDLIGNAILSVLGGHPSSLFVMFLFTIVTIVMTTIMSNSATANILYTVAATVCLAGNWDPRGIMLIIAIGNVISLGFPSGAAETALIYAAGNYSLKDVWKFTVPYILIAIVTIAFSANLFFPIYG
ncbi:MAG: SLC13 family permease [Erysipelotrichaceae bacterium]|nr:SLC13 family permease [Erysipelotrichaceae bacterium]